MAVYDRYNTPMAPGAQWPDGTPVSNWSQAVAALARHGSVALPGSAPRAISHHATERHADNEVAVLVLA